MDRQHGALLVVVAGALFVACPATGTDSAPPEEQPDVGYSGQGVDLPPDPWDEPPPPPPPPGDHPPEEKPPG